MMDEAKILEKNYGVWGNMRKKFMHTYREAEWELMLDAEKLDGYLTDFNEEYQAESETLLASALERNGITEELKAKDPMAWIQGYNMAKEDVKELLQKQIEEADDLEEPKEETEEFEDLGPEFLPDAKDRLA